MLRIKLVKMSLIIFLLFLGIACKKKETFEIKQDKAKTTVAAEKPILDSLIKTEDKSIEKVLGNCDSTGLQSCASVKIKYIQLVKAPVDTPKIMINEAIKKKALRTTESNSKTVYKDPEKLINHFFEEFKKFKKEMGKNSSPWAFQRDIKIMYFDAALISTECSEYSNEGGAHPNISMTYDNYDIKTGSKIKLDNIIEKNKKKDFLKLAEKKFRELKGIDSKKSLSEAGFPLFKGNKFSLTENFVILKTGITFYYNTYDLAPHAAGPTELVFSNSEIKDFFKSNYLLNL